MSPEDKIERLEKLVLSLTERVEKQEDFEKGLRVELGKRHSENVAYQVVIDQICIKLGLTREQFEERFPEPKNHVNSVILGLYEDASPPLAAQMAVGRKPEDLPTELKDIRLFRE